ncbi:MAG TPA: hypothetical protein VM422_15000, partial [Amaricoccus sp.]|nr:hypothetical protein [Amaricoccus sp.]
MSARLSMSAPDTDTVDGLAAAVGAGAAGADRSGEAVDGVGIGRGHGKAGGHGRELVRRRPGSNRLRIG